MISPRVIDGHATKPTRLFFSRRHDDRRAIVSCWRKLAMETPFHPNSVPERRTARRDEDTSRADDQSPVASQESVSLWIDQLKGGDRDATAKLWDRYFRRLMGLARKRLQDRPRLGADAEDVALSAFDSFFRGAEAGRFPKLNDRDDLWHLLVTITSRKAQRLVRDQSRQKRGGGMVLGESALFSPDDSTHAADGIEQILSNAPSPEFAAQLTEQFERLYGELTDPDLRTIATLRMEGYTIDEISQNIGRAPATIERKLKIIRTIWEKDLV
jgi:RNA polymerase sigma factor (sigma-70 family)